MTSLTADMRSRDRVVLAVLGAALGCGAVSEVSLGDGPFDAFVDAASDAASGADVPLDADNEASADVVVPRDSSVADVAAEGCAADWDPACTPFGPPQLVAELSSGTANGYDEDPTLTSDMREIYFLSTRDGGPGHGDVWRASRDSVDASWNPPTLVDAVSSPSRETSPAISFDGLSLYFASDRDGGEGNYDIYLSSRPTVDAGWSSPTSVAPLNSSGDDIPRPPGNHSLTMPMSYRSSPLSNYQIYTASWSSPTWSQPTLLEWVDTANLDVDPFLSDDNLSFAFSSDRLNDAGIQNLFLAVRADPSSGFATPVPLASLNTDPYMEAHPWLSPDQHEIYFDSDRSGVFRIYRATR